MIELVLSDLCCRDKADAFGCHQIIGKQSVHQECWCRLTEVTRDRKLIRPVYWEEAAELPLLWNKTLVEPSCSENI